jgi:hypothetical protein
MNWTEILANAGIPEPPGRDEAIAAARLATAERYAKHGQKRVKGNNTRKVKKVARVDYRAMRDKAKTP